MGHDERFRNAGRYAGLNGYAGGFPNFHQADYGRGVVHGTFLLPGRTVEWRDVPRVELAQHDSGVNNIGDVSAVGRAVNRWAVAHGFPGAIPTYEQADHGDGVVLGVLLLRQGVSTTVDVPIATIGASDVWDIPNLMRGASNYASANGYAAGFPTFEQADHGAGVVVGVHLLTAGTLDGRDVYEDVLAMQSRYSFAAGFSDTERNTIMERWASAYERLQVCTTVSDGNRIRINQSFRKAISHGLNAPANANASAYLNGNSIDINRTNFFGLVQREQAQTLLHEMTHCAGFSHPNRRDCPPATPPGCDQPGDNGPYYGTVPLQSELCIAGIQSDVAQCDVVTPEVATGDVTAADEQTTDAVVDKGGFVTGTRRLVQTP